MPNRFEEKEAQKRDPSNFVKSFLITKDGTMIEGNPDGSLKEKRPPLS